MEPFTAAHVVHAGREAVRLVARRASLEAVVVPGLGMLGASFRHRGEELLGLADALAAYADRGSTMGIPLLHPWANRLGGGTYTCAGKTVVIQDDQPRLCRDPNGLPIHGLLWASPAWQVEEIRADAVRALVAARLDFARLTELAPAFPFAHELTLEVALDDAGLQVTTELVATGADRVPVSFGFHPYFVLPDLPRERWHVALPDCERLVLDERMIPTGEREPLALASGPLGDRVLDDGLAGLPSGATLALAGSGRRIEVRFVEGYPFGQVFAPPDRPVVALEPMTAPTDALRSGDGLRVLEPGERYRAVFRIDVA